MALVIAFTSWSARHKYNPYPWCSILMQYIEIRVHTSWILLWSVVAIGEFFRHILQDSFRIAVTSLWAWWRRKSPGSPLFTQPCKRAQIKENIKAPCHWPFVRGIHRWSVNSPHKWPVTRKTFPFNDVIMKLLRCQWSIPEEYGYRNLKNRRGPVFKTHNKRMSCAYFMADTAYPHPSFHSGAHFF